MAKSPRGIRVKEPRSHPVRYMDSDNKMLTTTVRGINDIKDLLEYTDCVVVTYAVGTYTNPSPIVDFRLYFITEFSDWTTFHVRKGHIMYDFEIYADGGVPMCDKLLQRVAEQTALIP